MMDRVALRMIAERAKKKPAIQIKEGA